MKTAELAKHLGAKNLQCVSEFYGCTSKHLRDVHKRNQPAFVAMVLGYLEVTK